LPKNWKKAEKSPYFFAIFDQKFFVLIFNLLRLEIIEYNQK